MGAHYGALLVPCVTTAQMWLQGERMRKSLERKTNIPIFGNTAATKLCSH